ncbi:ATP-binding protein [Bacteroides oleiciplenus]|uniref:ATP-binding protein n=1 Tax=Bacteroides oleiciplenus TaxID=626931 RepID=A0A3E5B150_9BACE|nr:ATP-binding protein [Bacteroides oleiciplenus]RGN31262.1 ATP-binding protein [Bacteroides oleiciplenus]
MNEYIAWFNQALTTSIQLYFQQECEYSSLEEVAPPSNRWLERVTGISDIAFGERIVTMLALMPHVCPQILDIFFVQNKNFDRQYTEFGGWKGLSHGGFLPTGETVAFILAGEDMEKRKEVIKLFQKDHWFYVKNVIRLEGAGEGEPFLSGQLRVSEEFLSRVLLDKDYKPDYNIGFPAKRITTEQDWEDMVLDYQVVAELEEINTWISSGKIIMEDWGLSRFLKAGYRSLFYGPPGTGKTLAATLLGKKNNMDVYRIDLSMIVSKYIGETEKNLARVFDLAENRNWILFFDEADALFGKRTSTNTSNDRHANQEVAYLLQRIEDFPGMVILATNLRSNIDEAFSRRFQSAVYFSMPTMDLRADLWRKMLPRMWLGEDADELIAMAAETELSGGSIANVVRRCALYIIKSREKVLNQRILKEALQKEKLKG